MRGIGRSSPSSGAGPGGAEGGKELLSPGKELLPAGKEPPRPRLCHGGRAALGPAGDLSAGRCAQRAGAGAGPGERGSGGPCQCMGLGLSAHGAEISQQKVVLTGERQQTRENLVAV